MDKKVKEEGLNKAKDIEKEELPLEKDIKKEDKKFRKMGNKLLKMLGKRQKKRR